MGICVVVELIDEYRGYYIWWVDLGEAKYFTFDGFICDTLEQVYDLIDDMYGIFTICLN